MNIPFLVVAIIAAALTSIVLISRDRWRNKGLWRKMRDSRKSKDEKYIQACTIRHQKRKQR